MADLENILIIKDGCFGRRDCHSQWHRMEGGFNHSAFAPSHTILIFRKPQFSELTYFSKVRERDTFCLQSSYSDIALCLW